jgi:hypothetical protein
MAANKLFHYHANGLALSGRLDRPMQHMIEVQAGTTLPSTGGYCNARVDNFHFDDLVSFKAGYTYVSGSEQVQDGRTLYTTQVTSVVEGLNIHDMVTADRIVARLASSYEQGDESKILVLGSRFENLRIAGKKFDVEFHDELAMKLDTFAAARKEYETNPEFGEMAKDFFDPGSVPKKIDINGVVRCSLVKELLPAELPAIRRHGRFGHILAVPEFGKIHLAELALEHGRKNLTMMRVELGSPIQGQLMIVYADSNGRPPT